MSLLKPKPAVLEDEKKDKPFLLVTSRPLGADEKDLLRSYGKLIEWDESFINIPIESHSFDYLSLDVHNKQARMLLMKTDLEKYHTVIISRVWESEDDFIEDVNAENVLRSLPGRQPFKADFDKLLYTEKIRKPSCLKSILRLVFKILSGYSDK